MIEKLLAETPRSERAVPTKELSLKENYEEFVKACKTLVRIREMMGYDNHDECPEVMELIAHRESQGINDHSEIGNAWEEEKPIVYLDDLLGMRSRWMTGRSMEKSTVGHSANILTSRWYK